MRAVSIFFLLVFVGALGIFAFQNQQEMTIEFLDWSLTAGVPVIAAAIYLLGMLSGWTIVGMLRRSFRRVVEEPTPRPYAYR